MQGWVPPIQFTMNGTTHNMSYYLAYDIYPATLVKTIQMLQGEKRKLFVKWQEATRKDVGRTFGVLKSHFVIICGPSQMCTIKKHNLDMYYIA